jgi:hypothetical protein
VNIKNIKRKIIDEPIINNQERLKAIYDFKMIVKQRKRKNTSLIFIRSKLYEHD